MARIEMTADRTSKRSMEDEDMLRIPNNKHKKNDMMLLNIIRQIFILIMCIICGKSKYMPRAHSRSK